MFHASGTGATQAGIVGGFASETDSPVVVGVSVARARERGSAAVAEALSWVGPSQCPWEFDDTQVGAGYGSPTDESSWAVAFAARTEGLILDPVYTGKAFAGLIAHTRSGHVPPGSRVLFWHTGGLLNNFE